MAQIKNRLGRGLGGLISGSSTTHQKTEAPKPAKKPAVAKSKSKSKKVATKAKSANKAKSATAKKSPKVVSGTMTMAEAGSFMEIALTKIAANPYQPRREIADKQVEELAQSIRSEGLLQPVVVRAVGEQFELIAGERRLRAFKFLKKASIPCRVIEANDASSATLALIENLQRENLNPIDEALGYASLVRDFDLTQEAASARVGKGRATVANALRLLGLSEEIQGFLSRRLLSTGHAKVLLGLKDEDQRNLLARKIIESNISVREAEKLVKNLGASGQNGGSKGTNIKAAESTAIADLEKRIEKHFNTNVSIKHGRKKGKLILEYFGNEDLDRLLELLGINKP